LLGFNKRTSNYCKPVKYADWIEKLYKTYLKVEPDEFSIVYRFYSVKNSRIRYVGRSDNPLSRANVHNQQIGFYGMFKSFECQISWVDFKYFTGLSRFKEAYEEESKRFHLDEPDMNTKHPARYKQSWKCPNRYCEFHWE
jgi:hypothetical protein